jgi:transcription termination factor NusB
MSNMTKLKTFKNLEYKFNAIKSKRKSFNNILNDFRLPVKNIDNIIEYGKYYHKRIFDKMNLINKNILYIFLTDLQFNNRQTPIIYIEI